jgi:hypothetical protein
MTSNADYNAANNDGIPGKQRPPTCVDRPGELDTPPYPPAYTHTHGTTTYTFYVSPCAAGPHGEQVRTVTVLMHSTYLGTALDRIFPYGTKAQWHCNVTYHASTALAVNLAALHLLKSWHFLHTYAITFHGADGDETTDTVLATNEENARQTALARNNLPLDTSCRSRCLDPHQLAPTGRGTPR